MKILIRESQYCKLTEQRKSFIQSFIETKFPEMGRLRKRPTKSMSFGSGYKFFNPKTNEVLFHVVSGGPVFWEKGGKTRPAYPGVRLYVDWKLSQDLSNYFGEFDEPLLKWFNETYKQDADSIKHGIR